MNASYNIDLLSPLLIDKLVKLFVISSQRGAARQPSNQPTIQSVRNQPPLTHSLISHSFEFFFLLVSLFCCLREHYNGITNTAKKEKSHRRVPLHHTDTPSASKDVTPVDYSETLKAARINYESLHPPLLFSFSSHCSTTTNINIQCHYSFLFASVIFPVIKLLLLMLLLLSLLFTSSSLASSSPSLSCQGRCAIGLYYKK